MQRRGNKMNVFKLSSIAFASTLLLGCATNEVKDLRHLEKSPEERAFGDLEPYAVEMLDELRLLAKTRSAHAQALKGPEQRRQERMLSTMVLPGFEKVVDWNCDCEVETAVKGIAETVGYGSDRVFTYGQKPPGGVFVSIKLKDQPINDAIKIIDSEKGAQVDIMVDNRLKTIVVKYLETKA